jgi:hypothetical protein
MDTQQNYKEQEIANNADIEYSKPSKSRFLFLLFFFGFFIFCWSGCYKLYEHGFQKNDGIKAQESSLYEPKYK